MRTRSQSLALLREDLKRPLYAKHFYRSEDEQQDDENLNKNNLHPTERPALKHKHTRPPIL